MTAQLTPSEADGGRTPPHPAPFDPMVPILLADGSPVEDFVSTPGWKEIRRSSDLGNPAAVPITADWFEGAPHRRYYGRPWIMGQHYFDHLVKSGLERNFKVLDLGCGAGRTGALLAEFLDPDCYFGVDNHLRSLVAFAGYECPRRDLLGKRPQLLWSDRFEVEVFRTRFDLVLDLFVTPHLSPELREEAFRRAAAVTTPGAQLIMLTPAGLPDDRLAELGWRLVEDELVTYPILETGMDEHRSDLWHLLLRI